MSIERGLRDAGLSASDIKGLERRLLLKRGLTLGSLALLTGCDVTNQPSVDALLRTVSRFNDRIQAALFDPDKLAPTYADADVVREFRHNSVYGVDRAPVIDGGTWRLELSGLIGDKKPWTLAGLRALPQTGYAARHICVEGWSMIGKWGGPTLRTFLERVGADTSARYVHFRCDDMVAYHGSIDMPSALHPQTILAVDFFGAPLPPKYGAPMRLKMTTKLGFKQPKHITALHVTNDYPGGYWEDYGYNWFGGI